MLCVQQTCTLGGRRTNVENKEPLREGKSHRCSCFIDIQEVGKLHDHIFFREFDN